MAAKSTNKTQKNKAYNPNPNSSSSELRALKQENEKLRHELELVKVHKKTRHFWRRFAAIFFAVLAVVSFMLFNLSFWVRDTVTNTDTFVATMQPLIKDKDVQEAITTELSSQIFSRVDIEGELKKALPENIAFIAGPFASQVKSFTTGKIGELLNSQQAYDIWTKSLQTTHSTLINYITNESNTGVISVNDLYSYAGNELGNSQLSFLFNKTLPPKIGEIQITEIKWVPEARQAINVLNKLPIELFLLSVVFALLALWSAIDKKRIIVGMLVFSFVMMIATLIAIKVGIYEAGAQTSQQFSAAAESTADIITQPLAEQTRGVAWLIGSVLAVALVSSNISWVVWVRSKITLAVNYLVKKINFKHSVPNWLVWIADYKVVIEWTLVAVMFVAFALRMPPTDNGIIAALVGSAIMVSILELVSAFTHYANKQ